MCSPRTINWFDYLIYIHQFSPTSAAFGVAGLILPISGPTSYEIVGMLAF